jgi:hypothetical protein
MECSLMGRKAIGRKAMTAAERQQRRRKRLRRETAKAARQAEIAAKRAKNAARNSALDQRLRAEAGVFISPLPVGMPIPPLANPADEIARQLSEVLAESPELTIDDLRAAIDRRFGAPCVSGAC